MSVDADGRSHADLAAQAGRLDMIGDHQESRMPLVLDPVTPTTVYMGTAGGGAYVLR